jgi:hypothetical protein
VAGRHRALRPSPTIRIVGVTADAGEDAAIALIVVVAFFSCLGFIVSTIAGNKGRSRVGWFFLGMFFFVPALVGALLVKPNHDLELRDWVAGGGRLCAECREPLNHGAIRCRHCGAQQSERAPDAGAPAMSVGGVSRLREEQAALRFLDVQLTNVLESSVTGTATLDVRAMLTPIGFSSRLSTDRAQARCQKLVDEAMMFAGSSAGWVNVDAVRVPRSWAVHYQVLADLDENSPALVAFIERSQLATGQAHVDPAADRASTTEVVYDLGGWSATQVTGLTAALNARGASWELDGDDLVVGADDEAAVDALVVAITGENPDMEPADVPSPQLPPPPPPPPMPPPPPS